MVVVAVNSSSRSGSGRGDIGIVIVMVGICIVGIVSIVRDGVIVVRSCAAPAVDGL